MDGGLGAPAGPIWVLRLARLRRERESVVVVSPAAPIMCPAEEARMRRVIGIDVHRTFGEVVFWESGRLRHAPMRCSVMTSR